MKLRRSLALSIVLVMMLAMVAGPASAGGWATIELSKPVDSAVVGEAVTFEFQVLAHGISPVGGTSAMVTAIHAESNTKIEVAAKEFSFGNYTAILTFDQPGRWKVRATSTPTSTSFPTLYVTTKSEVGSPVADFPALATEEITLINFTFVPNTLEVKVGTAVDFTNKDTATHEVAFYESSIDDSGIFDNGESFTVTFIQPGKYHVACGPHPGMSATIIVK
jgi:plastocyanin